MRQKSALPVKSRATSAEADVVRRQPQLEVAAMTHAMHSLLKATLLIVRPSTTIWCPQTAQPNFSSQARL
jgi:hypothetical protein